MRSRSYERTWLGRRDAAGAAAARVHDDEKRRGGRPLSHLLRHSPQLFTDVRIAAADKGVSSIDELPRRYAAAKTVFLSDNELHSLRGIEQFADARVMTLAHNPVARFEELQHLAACTQLQQLALHDTPLAARPLYRARTIAVLHGLGVPLAYLDGAPVSAADVEASATILQRHSAVLAVLVSQECRIAQLALVVQLLQVHLELAAGGRSHVGAAWPLATNGSYSTSFMDGGPFHLDVILRWVARAGLHGAHTRDTACWPHVHARRCARSSAAHGTWKAVFPLTAHCGCAKCSSAKQRWCGGHCRLVRPQMQPVCWQPRPARGKTHLLLLQPSSRG